MNRELKFRGWHTKLNQMFPAEELAADQLTLSTVGEFINVHSGSKSLSEIYPADKFIPLQFTGLRDKNGVEVYEGDITAKTTFNGEEYRLVSQVVYNAPGFCLKFISGNEKAENGLGSGLFAFPNNVGEVIGNIYENPELLEEKS